MRDNTPILNRSGEHVATLRFNESYGLWQIARGNWLGRVLGICIGNRGDVVLVRTENVEVLQ